MSEENKVVVRRFFEEVINAGNLARADEFVTAEYVEHQHLPGAEGRHGIEVAKAFLSMMRGAFPDYRFAVEDLIAEGDRVVARVTPACGTMTTAIQRVKRPSNPASTLSSERSRCRVRSI